MEKYKILSIEIDGKIFDLRKEQEPQRKEKETTTEEDKSKYKFCSRCKKEKLLKSFCKDSHQLDGLASWCRECKSEYQSHYNKVEKSKIRRREYMREYLRKRREQRIKDEQKIKPDIPIINGCDQNALPITPYPESIDEHNIDSVINDPVKRKRFFLSR